MLIQCTKKLLDQLEIDDQTITNEPYHSLYRWHANIITIDRKKTVVLVNDETYFVIVFYGLKANDFRHFDAIVTDGIRQVLHDHCIDDEIIEKYVNHLGGIKYSKTHHRSLTSHATVLCEDLKYNPQEFETDRLVQPILSRNINKFPTQKNNKKILPKVAFIQALEKEFQRPIFKTRAAVIHVFLEIAQRKIWRELVVPLRFTFRDLHDILQMAFNWSGMHLHEFYIKDDEGENILNIGILGMEYDALIDAKKLSEEQTYLEDILTEYSTIHYVYDLGRYWDHQIVVHRWIEDYDRNIPICLDGERIVDPTIIEEAEHFDPDLMDEEDEFLFEEVNQRFAHYFGA